MAEETNAQSAQDVENLLAEIKSGEQQNGSADAANGAATTEPATETKPTDTEEADIVAAAAKLADNAEKKDQAVEGEKKEHHGGRDSGRGRGRGRGSKQNKSWRENVKSDLTSQQESDDPVAIRKQVEFYFSDSNLPSDNFLMTQTGGSENKPVPIATIHSFKRMRHFQPLSAIVAALKESDFLEVTDDDTAIRRKNPLPKDSQAIKVNEDAAMRRSVYAKGFGTEEPSTQFDIEAFFAPYGPTNAIRLRRTDFGLFKTSVFVEFETEELAKKFLELDPKPKYKGNDLKLIMSKKEYCDMKVKEIEEGKVRPNTRWNDRKKSNDRDWRERRNDDQKKGFRGGRGGGRGRGGRGRGRDDRRGGDRRDRDEKKKSDSPAAPQKDARGVPVLQTSTDAEVPFKKAAENGSDSPSKKRSRDDEGATDGQPAAKKVDA